MKVLDKKNTIKRNIIALLGWLFLIAVLMMLIGTQSIETNRVDDAQELYRIAQTQMAEGDFDMAIESFEHILEETPNDCVAAYILGELYLVKGLQEINYDATKAITYLKKSEQYADKVLAEYSPDVNAKFVKSLSLIHRGTLENDGEQQFCMMQSHQSIQAALEEGGDRDKIWFALGEWWLVLSESSQLCKKSVLESVYLEKSAIYLEDFSCFWDEADQAYTKACKSRERSILGNYGLMKMGLLQKNNEKVVDAYNDVSTHFKFYPTQQYYSTAINELWQGFLKDYYKQNFEVKPYLGRELKIDGKTAYASKF